MLLTEAFGIESQSNEFPELEPFKMAEEELIEYLPYIYHPKMDSEHEQSYRQVKTRRFVLDNKHKCQFKRNHSSTHVHYLPLDGMVNIPIYLVWAYWVRNGTTFLSDNRYF